MSADMEPMPDRCRNAPKKSDPMSADVEWDGRADDGAAQVGSDVGRCGTHVGPDFRLAAPVENESDAGRCGMGWES